ncbi:MAG: hypothetical protein Q8Q09_07910 [Deltaproteobacteria bacterium]|nr:hypothetical protein [Deltaproteobacteria bacterium]
MQVTLNESERQYLEALQGLELQLGEPQGADVARLVAQVRAWVDAEATRQVTLRVSVDSAAAQTRLAQVTPESCDQFADATHVARCHLDITHLVNVTVESRTQVAGADEPQPWERVTEPQARAVSDAIAALTSIQIRLHAVGELSASLHATLVERGARSVSLSAELRDARLFAQSARSRAMLQEQLIRLSADSLVAALRGRDLDATSE